MSRDRARLLVGASTAVLLVLVALTGLALARRYHPVAPFSDPFELTEPMRWSRRLVRWHRLALALAVPATIGWTALAWSDRGPRRRAVAITTAVVALATTVVASLTWGLVRYEQIALSSVTVGEDLARRGLWWTAFHGDVRFVLVGGAEVSQTTYARWLVVHLLSPLVALVALGASWRAMSPPGARRQVRTADGAED